MGGGWYYMHVLLRAREAQYYGIEAFTSERAKRIVELTAGEKIWS